MLDVYPRRAPAGPDGAPFQRSDQPGPDPQTLQHFVHRQHPDQPRIRRIGRKSTATHAGESAVGQASPPQARPRPRTRPAVPQPRRGGAPGRRTSRGRPDRPAQDHERSAAASWNCVTLRCRGDPLHHHRRRCGRRCHRRPAWPWPAGRWCWSRAVIIFGPCARSGSGCAHRTRMSSSRCRRSASPMRCELTGDDILILATKTQQANRRTGAVGGRTGPGRRSSRRQRRRTAADLPGHERSRGRDDGPPLLPPGLRSLRLDARRAPGAGRSDHSQHSALGHAASRPGPGRPARRRRSAAAGRRRPRTCGRQLRRTAPGRRDGRGSTAS